MVMSSLSPGDLFAGDYRIVSALSEGGMGAVYIAEQLSTGKQRALKLMLPQLVADPKLRARFEQEARIGARIESEHVVEVVGAGIDAASGAPWLAMEFLRGEDLAALVQRVGALSREVTLEIVEQLCHAVGAAHQAGIVHRDLKPENIFLAHARRTGAKSVVKVLDFGIAKVAAEAKATETAAVGSPMWMAPEQTARGGIIQPQTDVWAIGLIVFHLLTAHFYWRAAEDDSSTIAHLLREIVLDPTSPASVRAAEFGGASLLPAGFDAWFATSIDRNPAARFANATEQMTALRAMLGASTSPNAARVKTIHQGPIDVGTTMDEHALVASQSAAGRTVVAAPLAHTTGAAVSAGVARPPPAIPPPRSRAPIIVLALVGVTLLGSAAWLKHRERERRVASERAIASSFTPVVEEPAASAEPSAAAAPAPQDPFTPARGMSVIAWRGDLKFSRGVIAAARGDRSLIGDDELASADLSYAATPAAHEWHDGDLVIVTLDTPELLAGSIEHVRADDQLAIDVIRGKEEVHAIFSPPASIKTGQFKLDQAIAIRPSWEPRLREEFTAHRDAIRSAHDTAEAQRLEAEQKRKDAFAALRATAEKERPEELHACFEKCESDNTRGTPEYGACFTSCVTDP